MGKTLNRTDAPIIDTKTLWQMSPNDFNEWRGKNDYPRIINFLKRKLPEFEIWMKSQNVSDNILIKHSPSTFLRERPCIYLYKVLDHEKKEKETILELKHSVGQTFFHQNLVQHRQDIVPYPVWYFQFTKQKSPEIYVTMKEGRKNFIMHELELLDLGNCHLGNMFIIQDRHLDFVNISNLVLTSPINNTYLKLWFSSAINLTVNGDFPFVNAYNTSFYEVFNQKSHNLKLSNGRFQNWSFENCQVNLSASNAVLHLWEFKGMDFNAVINNSDILDCIFQNSKILSPKDFGRARDIHSHVKRLYSQIGKRKEASNHYYLERKFERKSFLHVKENYGKYSSNKIKASKYVLKIIYLLKYIASGFLNILWGYGERPGRVFLISIAAIIIFSFVYCFAPQANTETKYDFFNALYYSIVTFTTLGYGDIHQSNASLKLLSAFEALLGMTFWGILIAGFTSNSKDY